MRLLETPMIRCTRAYPAQSHSSVLSSVVARGFLLDCVNLVVPAPGHTPKHCTRDRPSPFLGNVLLARTITVLEKGQLLCHKA